MAYVIGSARISEYNTINGKVGDQKQKSSGNDYSGEVSLQNFYVHSLGWYVLRFKDKSQGVKCANAMIKYCNDANVGYGQSDRLGIMSYDGKKKVNADCSSLIRRCFKDATGVDPGNFSTASERALLLRTGLVEDLGKYRAGMKLQTGDILVTCTKGHTVCVTQGESTNPTPKVTKYKLTGSVNIRSGPGTNYKVIKTAHKGDVVEVTKVSDNNWGYIPKDDGWISLNTKYTVKI